MIDLPALLPDELKEYQNASDEEQLLDWLKKQTNHLIRFTEFLLGDETWSAIDHPKFTKKVLSYLADLARKDRLDMESLCFIAEHLHEHSANIKELLPLDMTLEGKEGSLKTNSLLFQAGSGYLHERFRNECLEQETPQMRFEVEGELLKHVNHYLLNGDLPELWKEDQQFLKKLIRTSRDLELEELELLAEDVLKRYVTAQNVYDYLEEACREQWIYLRESCLELITDLNHGVKLYSTDTETICFAFKKLTDDYLDVLRRVGYYITRLVFSGEQTQDFRFLDALSLCPHLKSIDISVTNHYSSYLEKLPSGIHDLKMAYCQWLDQDALTKILKANHHIISLDLSGNIQLDINAFATLGRYPKLAKIKLSRCEQINDDVMHVLVKGLSGLIELDLEGCITITDKGFLEMARSCLELVFLNLSRTDIGDGVAAEIGSHLKRLLSLNLSACPNITAKGVIDLIKRAEALRVIHLSSLNISALQIREIKRLRPFLTLAL